MMITQFFMKNSSNKMFTFKNLSKTVEEFKIKKNMLIFRMSERQLECVPGIRTSH